MNSPAAKPAATMLSFSDREGYFNLAAPTVATLTFCLQPVVSCQLCPPSPSLFVPLSAHCVWVSGLTPVAVSRVWWGMECQP